MGEHRSTSPDPRQLSDLERRVRRWRDANASPTGYGPGSMAIADDNVAHWWDVQTLLEVIDTERAAPSLDKAVADLAAVMGTSSALVEAALRAGMVITRDELDDMRRRPATTGEHPALAVPECNRPAHADGHHTAACYGEQPATAQPGTTDQREAHIQEVDRDILADGPGTLAHHLVGLGGAALVFALLRDVADTEPIQWQGEVLCTMCSAVQPVRGPIQHLISCPWVRVTQLVGVKPDA